MFSSPLPDAEDYRVIVSDYAQRYYFKRFVKEYKGRRWQVTLDSILQDLKRVHAMQQSGQVDELKHGAHCRLFKYDFTVAQTGISPKASGNRCIVFMDTAKHIQHILLSYGKSDLPKNQHETSFIFKTVANSQPALWARLIKDA